MSRIFLSHSSKDNDSAVALCGWLKAQGWDDVFLDLDPQRGIAAGDKWERSLNQAALRCEAVLFLVSRAWLSSDWCLKEFNLAHRLNKRLFGLLIEDIPIGELPATLTGTWQMVPLASGRDHIMLRAVLPGSHDEAHVTFSQEGLTRLRIGLERAGLDAKFFTWPPRDDPRRPPYRGLLPLEAGDAGIFFGREAPSIEALDRIRGMKDGAAPRLLVLLGASGAGKSSFLRAGLLPRLARDDRAYLPLPVVRPEHAVINGEAGLLKSLEAAFAAQNASISRAEIRIAIEGGAQTLRPLLKSLIERAQKSLVTEDGNAKAPLLVLAIDQGEELFLTDGATESAILLNLLRELLTEDAPALLSVITIRSDAYEQLQTAKALEGILPQILSLAPMPRGAYQSVIEGPAARLKETDRPLTIQPALTQALLSDIEDGGGRDALPLLAFTLERLYLEYGARGSLTLEDYDALGRIKGSIEAAVGRAFVAADNDPRIPRDKDARLALLRRGLIPWLAGIDPDTGSPRRVKAQISEIPVEARPLIDLLVEQRLLSTDVSNETGERTIEPAHEALLRQWGSLQGWLQEDFAVLTNLETVKRAARDWTANARGEDWLSHRAGRLEDAEHLLQRHDLAAKLDTTDRDYLVACRQREETERQEKTAALERRLKLQRRFSIAALLATLVMATFGGVAYWQKTIANEEKTKANQATELAHTNLVKADEQTAIAKDALSRAEKNAAEAKASQTSALRSRDAALLTESKFLSDAARQTLKRHDPVTAALLALEALPDAKSDDEIKRVRPYWAPAEVALESGLRFMREAMVIDQHGSTVTSVATTPDGSRVVSASYNEVHVWSGTDGSEIIRLKGELGRELGRVNGVAITADGSRIVTGGSALILWDGYTGTKLAVLEGHTSGVTSVAITPDGSWIASGSDDKSVRIWDGKTGKQSSLLKGHEARILAVALTADGTRAVTASFDGTARIWDSASGTQVGVLNSLSQDSPKGFISVGLTPDGESIITGSPDQTATIWDARSGVKKQVLRGHEGWVTGVILTADALRAVTCATDGTVRVWDAKMGAELMLLRGHSSPINAIALTQDGSRIVTGGGEEIATGKQSDNTVRIWSSKTAPELLRLTGHTKNITSLFVTQDGHRIISGSYDNTARIWDARTGAPLQVLIGHTGPVTRVAVTPDGSRVVTTSVDHTTRIWDAKTGVTLFVLKGHTDSIWGLAISPDGSTVITGSGDKTLRIWDMNTGAELKEFPHDGPVWSLAISPDGKRLVTGSNDTARILDSKTGAPLAAFKGLHGVVKALAFSPDGSRILTGSVYGVLGLWNSDSGAEISRMEVKTEDFNLTENVESVAFMPDGAHMLSAGSDVYSPDETAIIWDAKTFVETARLGNRRRLQSISAVAIMPDGNRAVIGSQDGSITIWQLFDSGQKLIDQAKDAVPRCLSPEERQQYFLGAKAPSWCSAHEKWPYDRRSSSRHLIKLGQDQLEKKDFENAYATFNAAKLMADSDVNSQPLSEALFGRGRANDGLGKYPEAIADFRIAQDLGQGWAGNWLWWSTQRFSEKLLISNPTEALLLSLRNYLGVTPNVRITIGQYPFWINTRSTTFSLGASYGQLVNNDLRATTDCDRLAAHPYDPFRTTSGIFFEQINGPATVAACTTAIEKDSKAGRFLLQRARGYAKSEQDARVAKDDVAARLNNAAQQLDLQAAMALGYPIALSNMATLYQDGDGVPENTAKAASLIVEMFNRTAACCAPDVVASLIKNDTNGNQKLVIETVAPLLRWSADLGNASAHEMLAALTLDGRLAVSDGVEPRAFALTHYIIAEGLYAAAGQIADSGAAAEQAKLLRGVLSSTEIAAAEALANNWSKTDVASGSPPWLR